MNHSLVNSSLDGAIASVVAIGKDNWPPGAIGAIIFPMVGAIADRRTQGATPAKVITMATAKSKQVKPAATAPVAAPAVKTIALRGGQAVASVKLTGKQYRVGAKHNQDWWAIVTKHATTDKPAPVQALIAANVPATFIGYTLRRGYLASV